MNKSNTEFSKEKQLKKTSKKKVVTKVEVKPDTANIESPQAEPVETPNPPETNQSAKRKLPPGVTVSKMPDWMLQQPEPIKQNPLELLRSPLGQYTEEHPLSLEALDDQFKVLREAVLQLDAEIAQITVTLARKRAPVKSNGKVRILDTKTNKVYKSKNNVYQTLLKAGELKELGDIFGSEPERNTFGWYALARAWPQRFQEFHEVKTEETQPDKS